VKGIAATDEHKIKKARNNLFFILRMFHCIFCDKVTKKNSNPQGENTQKIKDMLRAFVLSAFQGGIYARLPPPSRQQAVAKQGSRSHGTLTEWQTGKTQDSTVRTPAGKGPNLRHSHAATRKQNVRPARLPTGKMSSVTAQCTGEGGMGVSFGRPSDGNKSV